MLGFLCGFFSGGILGFFCCLGLLVVVWVFLGVEGGGELVGDLFLMGWAKKI